MGHLISSDFVVLCSYDTLFLEQPQIRVEDKASALPVLISECLRRRGPEVSQDGGAVDVRPEGTWHAVRRRQEAETSVTNKGTNGGQGRRFGGLLRSPGE